MPLESSRTRGFVTVGTNANGARETKTGQRGVIHTYAFDDLNRLKADKVQDSLPTGVDLHVRQNVILALLGTASCRCL